MLYLDTKLTERLRGEQGTDLGDYGAVKAADYYPVTLVQDTVR